MDEKEGEERGRKRRKRGKRKRKTGRRRMRVRPYKSSRKERGEAKMK
jgi:hypothetical protein